MTIPPRHRDERGTAMVVFAVLLTSGLLFGLGAMTVDLGQMYQARRAAQSAADLAALAGGDVLKDDPTGACTTALQYLQDNYPAFQPPPGGYACSPTGTNDNGVDTNGDGVGDASVVSITSGLQTTIRVVLPRVKVNFGFAEAFGVGHSSVTAGATVALRSAGSLMPFAVPIGCLPPGYNWYFDVKASSPANNSTDCSGPNQGNFGLVDFGGSGGGSTQVVTSIKNGGPPLTYIPVSPTDLAVDPASDDPACPESGSEGSTGTIGSTHYIANWDNGNAESASPGQPVPNCIAIESGLKASALADGLVGSSCDGRLAVTTTTVRPFQGCYLDQSRFAQFWKPGVTMSQVRNGDADTVSSAILQSKNLMVVPVIYAGTRPNSGGGGADKWSPVIGLMGFFLDCPYPTGATLSQMQDPAGCTQPFGDVTQIKELRGFLFDLNTIDSGVNNGIPVSDYYTGAGAAVPVLIKDPLN